jgi:hypothetical protein
MKKYFINLLIIILSSGCTIVKKNELEHNCKIMSIVQFIKFAESNSIKGKNANFISEFFLDSDVLNKSETSIVICLPGPKYLEEIQLNPEIQNGEYQIPAYLFWDVHFKLHNGKIISYHIINSGINDNK